MRYIKKTHLIDAVQLNMFKTSPYCFSELPEWLDSLVNAGLVRVRVKKNNNFYFYCKLNNRYYIAHIGDYLVLKDDILFICCEKVFNFIYKDSKI